MGLNCQAGHLDFSEPTYVDTPVWLEVRPESSREIVNHKTVVENTAEHIFKK